MCASCKRGQLGHESGRKLGGAFASDFHSQAMENLVTPIAFEALRRIGAYYRPKVQAKCVAKMPFD